MKNLIRLSSLLTMVMLLLAGATLVSCSDDDDDNGGGATTNGVVFDGKTLKIVEALYDKDYLDDGNNYELNFKLSDGSKLELELSGDKYDGKVVDLSKEDTEDGWYWFVWYSDKDGNEIGQWYGTNGSAALLDAGSTLYIKCLNKSTGEFEVKFTGKSGSHTMTGYYKGKMTEYIEER